MEKMSEPGLVEALGQRLGQQAGVHGPLSLGDELHCRQLPCGFHCFCSQTGKWVRGLMKGLIELKSSVLELLHDEAYSLGVYLESLPKGLDFPLVVS